MRAGAGSIEAVPFVDLPGITICYELDGPKGAPVVMLVNGLGGQLISWDDAIVGAIVDAGFRVLRFDNRDAGLSGGPTVPVGSLEAVLEGRVRPPYTLVDMAADAAGLIGALGVAPVHVIGVSMGGMIAQQLAIDWPDRVASLVSVMSTTGASGVGGPRPEALEVLLRPAPRNREEYVQAALEGHRVTGSKVHRFDEAWLRARKAREFDRAWRPEGVERQIAAILASFDRTEGLRRLRVPTLVIHGADDPLVDPSGGEATAAAIPGARLVIVPGMGHEGHEIPPGLFDALMRPILEHLKRAERSARSPEEVEGARGGAM
jgi:pimeloyl-ACP methyl ester carboxylesterase